MTFFGRTKQRVCDSVNNRNIIVFHARGAQSHYVALEKLANTRGWNVVYREANFVRSLGAGLLRRDRKRFSKALKNLEFCIRLAFGLIKTDALVVGFAPYDWRPLVFSFGFSRNRVFLHTSWPDWSAADMPMGSFPANRALWERIFLPNLKGIFFVTKHSKRSFLQQHYFEGTTSVVYHSYLQEYFFHFPRAATDTLRIGFAGRLVESKGLLKIIDIADHLKGTGIKIEIAGDGPDQEKLQAVALEKGLNIKFLGRLTPEELGAFFREIDILLLPSIRTSRWEEAFGMVIVEAMACGVIPLATDHAAPVEILQCINPRWIFREDDYVNGTVDLIASYIQNRTALKKDRKICATEAEKYSVDSIAGSWSPILASFGDKPT